MWVLNDCTMSNSVIFGIMDIGRRMNAEMSGTIQTRLRSPYRSRVPKYLEGSTAEMVANVKYPACFTESDPCAATCILYSLYIAGDLLPLSVVRHLSLFVHKYCMDVHLPWSSWLHETSTPWKNQPKSRQNLASLLLA